MEDKLNFMLIGKTGEGKSATGNSLLKRLYFKTSISTSVVTTTVNYNFGLFENYTLLVVDGPGLITSTSQIQDKTEDGKNIMGEALHMCFGGIDAFLLVIKFGNKFTSADKSALDDLKQKLGERYLDHVIVVLTCGDFYQIQTEDEEGDISFHEWCQKQTGEFRQLYEDCKGRFVLFNNKEKNEEKKQAQVQEIVQLTLGLREQYGRYTGQCFRSDEREFQQVILETKETQTEEEVEPQTAVDTKHIKMKDVKLNFLLMGKTGQGKSATGNALLQRQVFTAKADVTSVTKVVDFNFARFGSYILLVVDGPGLADTCTNNIAGIDDAQRLEEEEKMKRAAEIENTTNDMGKALAMCYGGVDAFLFVTRFGSRFTAEDKRTLEVLKQIFGDRYMDHVIVVVTCGDLYQGAMEEEQCKNSFHEWCRNQKGEFRQLYEDCEGRFVLFNNREKNKQKMWAQMQEIIQLAHNLQDSNGRYTSQCFQTAEAEREKLILELKLPQLTREIQEKISFLTADIENLSKTPSDTEKENIREDIQDLKDEIEAHDKGCGAFDDLKKLVNDLEVNLENVERLQFVANKMDNMHDMWLQAILLPGSLIVGPLMALFSTIKHALQS